METVSGDSHLGDILYTESRLLLASAGASPAQKYCGKCDAEDGFNDVGSASSASSSEGSSSRVSPRQLVQELFCGHGEFYGDATGMSSDSGGSDVSFNPTSVNSTSPFAGSNLINNSVNDLSMDDLLADFRTSLLVDFAQIRMNSGFGLLHLSAASSSMETRLKLRATSSPGSAPFCCCSAGWIAV